MSPSPPPLETFISTQKNRGSSNGRGNHSGRNHRGGYNGGRGKGCRSPHCQLYRKDKQYANQCADLQSFATRSHVADVNLTSTFHATYSDMTPDWYVNSSATSHMTSSTSNVHSAKPYNVADFVGFGNGNTLPITHIGHSTLHNIPLSYVLVIPHITKNFISISKLINDHHVDILFSKSLFFTSESSHQGDSRSRKGLSRSLHSRARSNNIFIQVIQI